MLLPWWLKLPFAFKIEPSFKTAPLDILIGGSKTIKKESKKCTMFSFYRVPLESNLQQLDTKTHPKVSASDKVYLQPRLNAINKKPIRYECS